MEKRMDQCAVPTQNWFFTIFTRAQWAKKFLAHCALVKMKKLVKSAVHQNEKLDLALNTQTVIHIYLVD